MEVIKSFHLPLFTITLFVKRKITGEKLIATYQVGHLATQVCYLSDQLETIPVAGLTLRLISPGITLYKAKFNIATLKRFSEEGTRFARRLDRLGNIINI